MRHQPNLVTVLALGLCRFALLLLVYLRVSGKGRRRHCVPCSSLLEHILDMTMRRVVTRRTH